MQDVPASEIRPRSVRDIRSGKGFREPQDGTSKRDEHPKERVTTKQRFKIPFTYTPLPKTFYTWLPQLSGTEIKVYLAIGKHTLDYHKFAATVPMEELSRLTGLGRVTIWGAVKKLEQRGILKVSRGVKKVSRYEILTAPYVQELEHIENEPCVQNIEHEKAV